MDKMNGFMFGVVPTIVVMFLLSYSSVTNAQVNTGNGYIYKLDATQDVWLEGTSNKGSYDILLTSKATGFPKKRLLVMFENLSSDCTYIKWAKMYLYYYGSVKARSHTPAQAPFIERTLQVHQIKKRWKEMEATSVIRLSGNNNNPISWGTPYIGLDGVDAASYTQDTVTVFTSRPAGYIEFDITEAVRNWKT